MNAMAIYTATAIAGIVLGFSVGWLTAKLFGV